MLQFIEIGVQMFDRQLVIRPHDRAFQETPNVLDVVGVNISIYPLFFGVFHCAVSSVRVCKIAIRYIVVCVDRFAFRVGIFLDKFAKQISVGDLITCNRICPSRSTAPTTQALFISLFLRPRLFPPM
jgi:hypothetical protein